MAKRVPRVGEILIRKGWITWEQLDEALRIQYEAAHSGVTASSQGGKKTRETFLSIGEILINQGWVKPDDLDAALKLQADTGDILGSILMKRNYVTEKNLLRALAIQSGMSFVEPEKIAVPADVIKTIPKHLAYQYQVLPLVVQGNRLLVAVSNPKNAEGIAAIEKLLNTYEILTALMTPADLSRALAQYYGPA